MFHFGDIAISSLVNRILSSYLNFSISLKQLKTNNYLVKSLKIIIFKKYRSEKRKMSELTEKIADFLRVLGDRTRLEILDLLKNGERTSEEIQNALDKRQSTISQQLKKLFDEDLITFEKKGNIKFYKIKNQYILKILTDIQSFVTILQKKKAMRFADLDIYDTLSSRRI